MKVVSFTLKPGNNYFGTVNGGPEFFIGRRVSYQGLKGLMNLTQTDPAQKYDRAQFRPTYGFWADFIHPTAMAEGGLYHTLNTYDRARFTFSFLQFAAHVADGDFVHYFQTLLGLPAAIDYFPDLRLVGGRICKLDGTTTVQLESATSTEKLMDYLNPASTEVEDTEVIQSARFIHWVQNDPQHRDVQIKTGIDLFKSKMKTYAHWYPMLNHAPAAVCTVVADIHHQGRAKVNEVTIALQDADPLAALLKIGQGVYDERLKTLRQEINALTQDGTYGALKYDAATNSFKY